MRSDDNFGNILTEGYGNGMRGKAGNAMYMMHINKKEIGEMMRDPIKYSEQPVGSPKANQALPKMP